LWNLTKEKICEIGRWYGEKQAAKNLRFCVILRFHESFHMGLLSHSCQLCVSEMQASISLLRTHSTPQAYAHTKKCS